MHYRLGIPCYAPFQYQTGIRMMIHKLKFQENLLYSRVLGHLIRPYIEEIYQDRPIDLIVPVPLHLKRLQQRGFNQALEIARYAFKPLKINVARTRLKRIKATKPQSECNKKQRASNVKDAFMTNKHSKEKHVIIFDDVITTGNTILACYDRLKSTGIERIDCWAVTTPN